MIKPFYNSHLTTGETILIIDDEVQIRRLLEITLNLNSFKTLLASSAKEGIASAASYNPSLILLDLGLPDDDGVSVLKKLREWYTNPVIILSLQTSKEDIIEALDSGANDYLTKPFRTGELLARIRTALRLTHDLGKSDSQLTFGSFIIDFAGHTARKNGIAEIDIN